MSLADFQGMQYKVLLKGYSTLGVGGESNYFYRLADPDVLPELFRILADERLPYFILGGGSNVLFSDQGFPGLVIKMEMSSIEVRENQLIAQAGATWPKLIKAAQGAHLSGFEPFNGLPGTIGGAVVGNAGCFGKETGEFVQKVKLFDVKNFTFKELTPGELHFGYRTSLLKKVSALVTQVSLQFFPANQGIPSEPISPLMRLEKQPPGKSTGSFFKNPSPEQSAGWLIDQCGLKGFQIGGAQISPKHANFFMNTGMATAADFLALGAHVKTAVQEKFGIILQEEVVIVPSSL
ncbi:MAG: UDP-N-acetylenolpyruvoylglucosamine reductase [uncultured bacterium]|nr:MAG: UDP-N-acetylenolpyruvoylglucosamine reductase [uncultured bacterium]KKT74847.1 MAG: UDP-N-acetylenolpyruvoylglucosamine reductase [Candidatus Peregrinibacteria bacterium GW2011_GWA2_44_7]